LTAERWTDRMLGQTRMLQLPASTLVAATGNNLRVAGDLCRRVLPIEMDAKVEHPELRTFERELLPWAIENRAKLVAAALTVLSAYRQAGEPVPPNFTPLGSFEAWSRTVCGALTWLGQPDPREAMTATRAADPKRLLLGHVLTGMHKLFGHAPQSTGTILDAAKLLTPEPDEHRDRLREAVEEITMRARDDRGARIMLGRYLETERGRVVGGLRLASQTNTRTRALAWTAEECG
jgi:putative DNA primase/helicase